MAFGKRTSTNTGTKNILQACEATLYSIKYLTNKACFIYTCHELIYIAEQSYRWEISNLTLAVAWKASLFIEQERNRKCPFPFQYCAELDSDEASISISLDEYWTNYYLNYFHCQVFGKITLSAKQSVKILPNKSARSTLENLSRCFTWLRERAPSQSMVEFQVALMVSKFLLTRHICYQIMNKIHLLLRH